MDLVCKHLPAIVSIVVMEGLLSVDNALVNAGLAKRLGEDRQRLAIIAGLLLGAVLRFVALLGADLIMQYPAAKLLGAAYLVFIMVKNLCCAPQQKRDSADGKSDFFRVVALIAVTDIIFSVDNVVAALGMSPNFYVVVIGVSAGILVMLFATQLVVVLMKHYPLLEKTAYLIVGFIGITMFLEEFDWLQFSEPVKFLVIMGLVGTTIGYENWKRREGKNP